MQDNRFDEVIDEILDNSRTMLTRKSGGYSDEDDRLHNFRTAAALNDCTMEQSLWGMLTKHIVSIRDMVQSGESYSHDIWDEKLGDAINYLAILKAITVDKDEKEERDASDAALASLREQLVFTPERLNLNHIAHSMELPPRPATQKSAYTDQINTDLDSIRRVADKQNAQQHISHTTKKEL